MKLPSACVFGRLHDGTNPLYLKVRRRLLAKVASRKGYQVPLSVSCPAPTHVRSSPGIHLLGKLPTNWCKTLNTKTPRQP